MIRKDDLYKEAVKEIANMFSNPNVSEYDKGETLEVLKQILLEVEIGRAIPFSLQTSLRKEQKGEVK